MEGAEHSRDEELRGVLVQINSESNEIEQTVCKIDDASLTNSKQNYGHICFKIALTRISYTSFHFGL